MKKPSKKEVFSIPNIMCYFRILLIPVFCYIYITAQTKTDYMWAFAVFLISSLTDLFDGMIARKFNMVTELGKVLDPVADKLNHGALALCLAFRYPLMWWLIALMVIKEGYMAVMGLKFLKKGKMMDGAMWYGKICTAVMFVGLLSLLLFYQMSGILVNTIIIVMIAVNIFALCMYIPFYNKMKKENSCKENSR